MRAHVQATAEVPEFAAGRDCRGVQLLQLEVYVACGTRQSENRQLKDNFLEHSFDLPYRPLESEGLSNREPLTTTTSVVLNLLIYLVPNPSTWAQYQWSAG